MHPGLSCTWIVQHSSQAQSRQPTKYLVSGTCPTLITREAPGGRFTGVPGTFSFTCLPQSAALLKAPTTVQLGHPLPREFEGFPNLSSPYHPIDSPSTCTSESVPTSLPCQLTTATCGCAHSHVKETHLHHHSLAILQVTTPPIRFHLRHSQNPIVLVAFTSSRPSAHALFLDPDYLSDPSLPRLTLFTGHTSQLRLFPQSQSFPNTSSCYRSNSLWPSATQASQ